MNSLHDVLGLSVDLDDLVGLFDPQPPHGGAVVAADKDAHGDELVVGPVCELDLLVARQIFLQDLLAVADAVQLKEDLLLTKRVSQKNDNSTLRFHTNSASIAKRAIRICRVAAPEGHFTIK